MNRKMILIAVGGLGDVLICTPTFAALKQKYPDRKIIVYCMNAVAKSVLDGNPHLYSVRVLRLNRLWKYPVHLFHFLVNRKGIKHVVLDFHHLPVPFLRKKGAHAVADIFNLTLLNDQLQLFLTEDEDRRAKETLSPYWCVVILHVHSRSSKNHHWLVERWQNLVAQLPSLTFLQIGHLDEPYVSGALDFRGKTTIREAFALIKNANSFVGVESVFGHSTNAFGVPGVVLFGDSSPDNWGHPNNVNIYRRLRCSPCYSYLGNTPCPYNHECMESISVSDVKMALLFQLLQR